jgi:hypothetical protein
VSLKTSKKVKDSEIKFVEFMSSKWEVLLLHYHGASNLEYKTKNCLSNLLSRIAISSFAASITNYIVFITLLIRQHTRRQALLDRMVASITT